MVFAVITQNEWFVVACVTVIFILIPTVCCAVGFSRRQVKSTEWADGVEFGASETCLLDQFLKLGFEPFGLRQESITFLGPHWYLKSNKQQILLSSDGKTLALAYRLYRSLPVEVLVASQFDDGSILSTKRPGTPNFFATLQQPTTSLTPSNTRLITHEMECSSMKDLVESHQQHVQHEVASLVRETSTLGAANTIIQTCLDTRAVRELIRQYGRSTLLTMAFQLGVMCVVLGFYQPLNVGLIANYCVAVIVALITSSSYVMLIPLLRTTHKRSRNSGDCLASVTG